MYKYLCSVCGSPMLRGVGKLKALITGKRKAALPCTPQSDELKDEKNIELDYCPYIDYRAEIRREVEKKDFEAAAYYERLRNAKIDGEGLSWEKTYEFTSPEKMKLVYIAHPFLGKPENIERVQRIIIKLLHKYPDIAFYSPLHATGFYYFELTYEQGMQHCLEALRRCDELWLCEGWQESQGCKLEMQFAKDHGIPIKEALKEEPEYYVKTLEASNGN